MQYKSESSYTVIAKFRNFFLLVKFSQVDSGIKKTASRVSNQPDGVGHYRPVFRRHTQADHPQLIGNQSGFDLSSPLPVLSIKVHKECKN